MSQSPLISLNGKDEIKAFNAQEEIKALVSWVNGEYERAKSARVGAERQWRLNLNFYHGKQNHVIRMSHDSYNGKLFIPEAPPWRVRSVTNRIRPIIRTEYSRLTSNNPIATVVPASSEDEDLFAAQAAEQVWQSEYHNKKLKRVFGRTAFWTLITGNGFMKEWWDPTAPSGYKDELGNTVKGDIKYAPVTPFHLLVPDLQEEEIENQPFVINIFVKSIEWCRRNYGFDFMPNVKGTTIIEDSVLNIKGGADKHDSILIQEMWLKPDAHKDFPEGGFIQIVSDQVVQIAYGQLFAHGEYPFIHFPHIPTGTFYGESVITDLVMPQREYNRTRSQIIEAKNTMAKPQLMAPKGTIDPSKITTQPGQVIEYMPGFGPPSPLPIQPIPGYVLQELDIIKADMEDISSQHEVSRGETPGSVTAATAISFLQEKDDSVMSHTYQAIEAGWEKIARQCLSHVVEYWELPRVIRTTGVDGSFDAIVLKGAQIAAGTDLRMEDGSALPQSKAARQAFIMDMMKLGFIDPNRGLELMEIGGIQRLYEEIKIDERQAQRENLRMQNLKVEDIERYEMEQFEELQRQMETNQAFMNPGVNPLDPASGMDPVQGMAEGAPTMGGQNPLTDINTGMMQPPPINMVPVNTWDNHGLHIEVHNKFRKSQAFEMLDEKVKVQFEAHVRAHATALNNAAMGAMMMGPPGEQGPGNMPMPPGMEGMELGNEQGNNQFGPPGGQEGMPEMPGPPM